MKVYIDLTNGEWRALITCVSYSNRSCKSCCAYPEMQNKKTKCYNCDFTKDREKLIHKLSNSSPIDHDKEVRKQVCDEIREILNSLYQFNDEKDKRYTEGFADGTNICLDQIKTYLDQIEKGDKE